MDCIYAFKNIYVYACLYVTKAKKEATHLKEHRAVYGKDWRGKG